MPAISFTDLSFQVRTDRGYLDRSGLNFTHRKEDAGSWKGQAAVDLAAKNTYWCPVLVPLFQYPTITDDIFAPLDRSK